LQHSSGEKAISYIHLLLNKGGTESMEMTAEMVLPCMEMTAEQKHAVFSNQCIFPKAIRQTAELRAATDCSIVPNVQRVVQ
jgi:hypothetical protein